MKDYLTLNNARQTWQGLHVGFLQILILVLAIIFLALFLLDMYLHKTEKDAVLLASPVSVMNPSKYPIIKTPFNPIISAKGAVVLDAQSGVVLFAKNPDLRFSPASTTKIMTALTALNYFKQDDILTVKSSSFEGSVVGLFYGEKMTFENLLYAMLLPSGNDAAVTIAQNYPEGERAFIDKMNKNAKNWHLYDTHYEDPAGLADEGDYTTPLDLARLTAISQQNVKFKQIVATRNKVITDVSGNVYSISNLNKLLGFYGVDGVKTGYTEEAGEVLVTSKIEGKQNNRIITVVMGSKDRFLDTQKLLSLISGNINYLSIHP